METLRVLRLPSSLENYDSRVTSRTTRQLVQVRTNDFTTGKRVIKDEYVVREINQSSFTGYTFNQLRFLIDDSTEQINDTTFVRERFENNGYWYAAQTIKLHNDSFDFITTQGMNVTNGGVAVPFWDRKMIVKREEYVVTKTFTSTRPSVSYPNILVSDIEATMKVTPSELEEMLRTTYHIQKDCPSNWIKHTAIEGVFANGKADMNIYYNNSTAYPSGMWTSYNKTFPGYVKRWRLYESGKIGSNAYGATVVVQLSAQDEPINIVAGSSASWNAETRTLTYNKNGDNTLWATFEELPAQGKNWGNEAIYKIVDEEFIRIS